MISKNCKLLPESVNHKAMGPWSVSITKMAVDFSQSFVCLVVLKMSNIISKSTMNSHNHIIVASHYGLGRYQDIGIYKFQFIIPRIKWGHEPEMKHKTNNQSKPCPTIIKHSLPKVQIITHTTTQSNQTN